MKDKRQIDIPFFPYVLFVISLATIFSSGLIYLNFPSSMNVVWGVLAAGIIIMILALVLRPIILKEIFANKKTLLWVNDAILVFAMIGIGVLLSHIAFRRNFRYDFTKAKLFSISDQTIKTVRGLTKEVKVTAFYPQKTGEEEMLKNLLNEYKRQSDKFSFKMVDPYRDPITTKAMNIANPGTVVVQCGTNRKDIFANDIFERPNRYMNPKGKPKFRGEQTITSAIINVISGHKRAIQFIKGHEEASLSGYKPKDIAGVNELLTKENYDVSDLNLTTDDIATATSVLAIISPQRDYTDLEIEKIRKFLKEKNGRLIVALDPMTSTSKLEDFLTKDYGVMVNKDIIVDPRGVQQKYWTVIPEFGSHQIIKPLKEKKLISLMFHCRSLSIEKKKEYKYNEFLKTIAGAYAKRSLPESGKIDIRFESGKDARGPLNLAVAIEDSKNASGSRILVFGDSDFASNAYVTFGGNKDLLVNSVNWLAGQEQLISIRPKIVDVPRIVINANAANRIFTLCVVVSPLLIVLLGGIVYFKRRRV